MSNKLISCVDKLHIVTMPFKCLDPFLFCVYHKDNYPAGDAKMQAPREGNGSDFDPSAPYRMYHGDRIPGFPQHPHRGFETVTATLYGIIDHTDSLGNAGRYGHGDLQWMTAGKGIVHGENFPLIHADKPNPTKFFQIWLNLPSKSKMVPPEFVMHWAEEIPKFSVDDNKVHVILWAGELNDHVGLSPPANSWAANSKSELGIYHLTMSPTGVYTLPRAKSGSEINRMIYFLEGSRVSVGGQSMSEHCALTVDASQDVTIENDSSGPVEILILQGRPIGEQVSQRGPFVMNTDEEIQQAYLDYRNTKFGGWPWPQDAMVFPRDKGRFALSNGQEYHPPKDV